MLNLDGINYWAVLVAWLTYMGVGAWWYSTAGFAKRWTEYTSIDILKIPQDQANRIIMFVAASSLLQSFALAIILHSIGITSVVDSIVTTLVIWLGFTTATTVGVTLYSKRSWKFLWLNASYFLVVMVIAATIFAVWK